MKRSHMQTPRSLNECQFTPGYKRLNANFTSSDIGEEAGGWAIVMVNFVLALILVLAVAAAVIQWAGA